MDRYHELEIKLAQKPKVSVEEIVIITTPDNMFERSHALINLLKSKGIEVGE